jgi:hypothetical protein
MTKAALPVWLRLIPKSTRPTRTCKAIELYYWAKLTLSGGVNSGFSNYPGGAMKDFLKTTLQAALVLIVILTMISLAILAFDTEEQWHEKNGMETTWSQPEHLSDSE